MELNKELAIPLYYEIYKQDLTKPYIALELLGVVNTIEEARTCCKLFQEAIQTANSRGLDDERGKTTVIFRPVLKGVSNDQRRD